MNTENHEQPAAGRRVEPVVMRRFWISWIQRTPDHRPVTYPPNDAILGWWCSGYDSDDNAVICAAVQADDPGRASAAIFEDWPEAAEDMRANGWRFFEHDKGSDWMPGDRFPLADWMKARFGVDHANQGD